MAFTGKFQKRLGYHSWIFGEGHRVWSHRHTPVLDGKIITIYIEKTGMFRLPDQPPEDDITDPEIVTLHRIQMIPYEIITPEHFLPVVTTNLQVVAATQSLIKKDVLKILGENFTLGYPVPPHVKTMEEARGFFKEKFIFNKILTVSAEGMISMDKDGTHTIRLQSTICGLSGIVTLTDGAQYILENNITVDRSLVERYSSLATACTFGEYPKIDLTGYKGVLFIGRYVVHPKPILSVRITII